MIFFSGKSWIQTHNRCRYNTYIKDNPLLLCMCILLQRGSYRMRAQNNNKQFIFELVAFYRGREYYILLD